MTRESPKRIGVFVGMSNPSLLIHFRTAGAISSSTAERTCRAALVGRKSVSGPNPLEFQLMTTLDHRQQLLTLLARISFRLGQFKLSSGATSDYYIDCRTTTLHAEGGRLTGHSVLELLEQEGIDAEAVGGLTMGADPIVSNVATASAWRALSRTDAPLLHGFLVRKAEKAHGTGRRIEGFCRPGARVVIVDDVCTTGASTINAIEAAREAEMVVAATVCIVEREEANGRPAVEAAAAGAPFLSLFTANQVRAEHIRQQGR
jgi:orotate phosphoribosyltransferase